MIRLARPDLEGSLGAIESVLREGFLVQGKNVERFEEAVAAYVGRRHAVAVSSGTSAIQCALLAAGVGEGDEVVVPDFTFPATANAVVACGARPVLADVDASTFNVTAGAIRAVISPRTKAVMPVDLFGLAADFGAVEAIARENHLVVIEDSACALGSALGGRKCGSFGEASVISFHPRKIVTTGEGGMVLTDDPDWERAVRRLRNHGIDGAGGTAEFVSAGYNMRMTEIQACMGIAQMAEIQRLVEGRRRVAGDYRRLLAEVDEIAPPGVPDGYFHSYQAYVVMVDPRVDRDRLIEAMKAAGVETAIGTYAVHAQPYYRQRFGYREGSLPVSWRAFRHSLALPMYASMDQATAAEVVACLKQCVRRLRSGG
ncbi:MAG: DegT/DnrJ/EryC1/StrS family aminotransferase [bacterium]